MNNGRQFSVTVGIDEDEEHTRATATLRTRGPKLTGVGTARRVPAYRDVPEICRELAISRALADLSHQLFDTTVADIECFTHTRDTTVS